MIQKGKYKKFALASALSAAVLASVTLICFGAAPPHQSLTIAPAEKIASDTSFSSICATNAVEDTSRDPAWIAASYEGDNCIAPTMPALLDGVSATREEIVAGMAAAKNYSVQSDAYQKCISDFVASRKAQDHQMLGKSLLLVEAHRVFVSEKDKTKADNRIKVAIEAFNEYGSECTQ